MFRRKNNVSLPMTMGSSGGSSPGGFLGRPSGSDGSGRAIKMDAPIVKSWKQASGFTRYSYYSLAFFILLMFTGYRYLRASNASIWLTCHQQECTLELTPGGGGTIEIAFPRTQLENAEAIKTDYAGNFLSIDTAKYEPPQKNKKGRKKYKSGSYKGPDEKGEYKSYQLRIHKKTPDGVERPDDMPDGDFTKALPFMREEDDMYVLGMRQFGLKQSRTRVRSSVNKVESFVKRRRQKLLVKESATLPWQGIVFLIFGLLGVMLSLLIGQFWDEEPQRYGGPGSRRTSALKQKKKKFVVDTGRPSKYPPGYQSKRFE